MSMLWPERSEARARHSLNEALHRLRSCLGAGRLLTEGETVALAPEGLTVDGTADEAAQHREFLEGFTLEDSQPFDEWVENERRRQRDATLSASLRSARRLLAEGKAADAAALARSALERDRLNEEAVRLLMGALALGGDQAGALAALREYRQQVADLGEKPGAALAELAERIRAGRVPVGAGTAPAGPRLVGRAAAMTTLTERLPLPGLAAARGLAVLGEPGQGKTRVLRELESRAALAGITVAGTRALPSDQGRSWSTLRGLFRGGLLRAPGLVGAEPARLRILASVVPELAERFPPSAPADDGELAYSLAQALEATAEDSPLLLTLDDAHFADGASLRVLHAALEQLSGNRVTLALSAAPNDPDGAPELLRLVAEIGRGMPGTAVRLEPLSRQELGTLVADLAPWAAPAPGRDRLVRRLAHETSGNVFLAVTLLRGISEAAELQERAMEWPVPSETLEAALPGGIPLLIQHAVMAQIARVERPGQEILAVAASLGPRVDVPLLAAVTGVSELELADRLAAPERLQLIVATEEGYRFPGAVIAAVLEHVVLTPGRRRDFRRRAAELLGSRSDSASRLWRLELLARLGHRETVAAEAVTLGETLLDQGDRHAARLALRLAGEPGGAAPESVRRAWLALRNRLDGQAT
jgi:predicted ATPase